jgi:hypothetical protein
MYDQSRKGDLIMRTKRFFFALTLTAIAVLSPCLAGAQSPAPKGKLDGTWNVTLSSGDFQEKERFTFVAGQSANEGSLIFSNEIDAVPPCGTDHGAWIRTGSRAFATTHGAFCIDLQTFSPAVTIQFRESITVNNGSTVLNGSGLFEVFDPSGNLLFSAPYTLYGTRMAVSPPPDLADNHSAENSASADERRENAAAGWRKWMLNRPPR